MGFLLIRIFSFFTWFYNIDEICIDLYVFLELLNYRILCFLGFPVEGHSNLINTRLNINISQLKTFDFIWVDNFSFLKADDIQLNALVIILMSFLFVSDFDFQEQTRLLSCMKIYGLIPIVFLFQEDLSTELRIGIEILKFIFLV